MKKTGKTAVICLLISCLAEIFVMNYRGWESRLFQPLTASPVISFDSGFYRNEDGTVTAVAEQDQAIIIDQIDQQVDNIRIDLQCLNQDWVSAYPVRVLIRDEGWSADYYEAGTAELIPSQPASQFLRLHAAGKIQAIRLEFSFTDYAQLAIGNIAFNAPVPFHFSMIRTAAMLTLLCLIALFRNPAAYRLKASGRQAMAAVLLLATLHSCFYGVLTCSNPALMKEEYSYAQEYQKLAEAFREGRLSLAETPSPQLQKLENPYDYSLREASGAPYLWDHAYYHGKYYVYFGAGPVILMYLPFLLLTQTALSNYAAILVAQTLLIFGLYLLLMQTARRHFPQTPLIIVLLLSAVTAFGCGAFFIARHPDIYSVPLITGLALSVWGLLLWEVSIQDSGRIRLLPCSAGSLCMAMVAACRPQLVLLSLCAIALFWDTICQLKKQREARKALAAALLPYGIVAVALMLYNAARFGSPLDFGANYNLTTNDMTKRGFVLDRIGDGLFYYLLQLPQWQPVFPFLQPASFSTSYLGMTIREMTYGGLLGTNWILWVNAALVWLKSWFQDRRFLWMCRILLVSGVIVVILDTQMAGILQRYFADFALFFFLPAVWILLAVTERMAKNPERLRRTGLILLTLGMITIVLNGLLFFAPDQTNLMTHNPQWYYRLRMLMQWW